MEMMPLLEESIRLVTDPLRPVAVAAVGAAAVEMTIPDVVGMAAMMMNRLRHLHRLPDDARLAADDLPGPRVVVVMTMIPTTGIPVYPPATVKLAVRRCSTTSETGPL